MVVLGNRGRCAQPCRLPYTLISKPNHSLNFQDKKEEILDRGHIISPRDLCGLDYIPALIKAGVCCFKIEGRLKSPEYVATVTRIYRKYIDLALSNKEYIIDEKDKKDLMQVFNRGGFSSGHLGNLPNQNLIFKEKPNNMGIEIGIVENYNSNKGHIRLQLKDSLSIGDTITFEKEPSKYTISELMIGNTNLDTANKSQKVTIGRMKGNILGGDKIYKISSKELSNLAKQSFEHQENIKIPVNCIVTIKKGIPMNMQIICTNNKHGADNYHNIKVDVNSDTIPTEAIKSPITVERIEKQISKTNNTPFVFENISINLEDNTYIPSISALNELRRTALEKLEENVILNKTRNITLTNTLSSNKSIKPNILQHPKIAVTLGQLHTDCDYTILDKEKINKIYLPLKFFINKDYANTIKYLSNNYDTYIYLPTIIKANYRNIILNSLENILDNFNIKGFIISNIADFKILEKYHNNYEFIGNYSLNTFNNNTLQEYQKLGLNKITISRELNKDSIKQLSTDSNIEKELIVYGNLPIMAINYCLLGKTNKCYPNCGINCLKNNTYYLRDRLRI